jgi:hypothetical protein
MNITEAFPDIRICLPCPMPDTVVLDAGVCFLHGSRSEGDSDAYAQPELMHT